MNEPYTLEECYDLLNELAKEFLIFVNNLMNIVKVNRVNLIGIGNSISGGWTAINNNVCPWLKKFAPFVNAHNNMGLNINFVNYSIVGRNSNQQIYDFLNSNPTMTDVRNHFLQIFDEWKKIYNNTFLANYVDKDIALTFYPQSDENFTSFFDNNSLSITSFFGCTGELLAHLNTIFLASERKKIVEKEMLYLRKIIFLIINQSLNSYVFVGNFPNLTTQIPFLTSFFERINFEILAVTKLCSKTCYFNGIYLDLFKRYNGKLKVDNHPSLEWQYTSLYNYVNFIMQQLPILIMQQDEEKDKQVLVRKYAPLDYDGLMKFRI